MPQWVWRSVYGRGPTGPTVQSPFPSKFREHFDTGPNGEMFRRVEPRGNQPLMRSTAMTVRAVCANCNNGWMAKLETEAKPILTRINADRRWSLSPSDVSVVRRWAIKTALMLERADLEYVLATPDMYRAIAGGVAPPGNWYVGLCQAHQEVEFRLTSSPVIQALQMENDQGGWEDAGTTVYAMQHIVVPWRAFFIVRYTPFAIHRSTRLDHELKFMPGGVPLTLVEGKARNSWALSDLPVMTREHIDQLTYWGHGRTKRGGLHLGLGRDGKSPVIYNLPKAYASMARSGEFRAQGVDRFKFRL
jgi:hypothetical protein